MTRPGDRLRQIAVRIFSVTTMDRLIDPVVADLQSEYDDAVRRGRVWTSRWVRLAGYVALLKAIAIYGCTRAAAPIHNWTADDHRAFDRVVGFTAALVVVATLLLVGRPILYFSHAVYPASLLVYLIPQALPTSVPVALTFGILFGLRGRAVSRRVGVAVLATALGCAVASFVLVGRIIPAANQAFRVSVAGNVDLPKGPSELTFRELRQRIDDGRHQGGPPAGVRALTLRYQSRWALALATIVLAPFALVVVTRCPRRLTLGVAGFSVLLIWYVLLCVQGSLYAPTGAWPVFAAAWLPNGGIVLLSLALLRFLPRNGDATATPAQTDDTVASS